jgi:hypothetical protein
MKKWNWLLIDTIIYVENPRESTKIFLDLINLYSKVAGYRVYKRSTDFLYTNNK